MTPAKVLPLPNVQVRTERQLKAAWSECDRIEAELAKAKAKARVLERQVAAARGYGAFITREALERSLRNPL